MQGRGKVVAADTASRHGTDDGRPRPARRAATARCRSARSSAERRCATASRLVSFSDFINQIDYAKFGKALNDRAIAAARNGLDLASLTGKTITFAGAAAQPSGNSPLQLTPAAIAVAKEAGS